LNQTDSRLFTFDSSSSSVSHPSLHICETYQHHSNSTPIYPSTPGTASLVTGQWCHTYYSPTS